MEVKLHDGITGKENELHFLITGQNAPDHPLGLIGKTDEFGVTVHLGPATSPCTHKELFRKAVDEVRDLIIIASGYVFDPAYFLENNMNVRVDVDEPVVQVGTDTLHNDDILPPNGLYAGDGKMGSFPVIAIVRHAVKRVRAGKK